jgi:23S rRNA pseudouridine1911/1915/1917 synthase
MPNDVTILYEDDHLVVAVKPVGVLSEESESGASMPVLLRTHYAARGQKDYVATVHRLDRIVGGVMVFSRRREITGKLIEAVREHRVTKEYLAVLRGHPAQPEATLTDLLFRDAAHNKSYVVKRMRKGVREATLDYRELGRTDALSLVRIRLHTGRTHQLRIHCAHADGLGCPILGDNLYGTRAARLYLHAAELSFTHPQTGRLMRFRKEPDF